MITLIGGSKRKKSRYIDYEWRLFYTNYIEAADLVKLKNIENDEINGREIWLTPHIDIEGRYFRVFILDEKREIDLHYHQRGNDETANKGFEISFVNADAILEVNMVDPNEYVAGVGGIQGQVD
jgi:hypothetical protein